ncbi:InlB B-repeat-containing protein [Microterricola viridarii]|uniref:Listeria/Bacterioides repeat-containing protein n=1 Tax=Microterricola viridarii TaxID=412690 RepID=A0A1H1LFV6_9MICO|nr:InlB B-repeat-containing protein [Microterricola viridarii]SDR73190.1 Listeria/Bacterioides repeat-containing protein [Microterricola viridarii]
MRKAATKTTAFVATAAAIGFTSLFGAVSPANATGDACTATGGTLLDPAGNVCEMKITAGNATFQPTAAMTKLEVLLVGGGGAGAVTNAGYAPGGGGGGGQVKVVGFDAGSMSPVTVTVGSSSRPTTAAQGSVAESAGSGAAGSSSSSGMNGSGGASGSGNAGVQQGGGGGAGAAAVGINGGAGATAASVAAPGSLFEGDTSCYGGGGANGSGTTVGTATCGGGALVNGSLALIAPTVNSGGGGAGGGSVVSPDRNGASGIAVVRWSLQNLTVSFDTNGHGTVAPVTVVTGGTVAKPVDPTAAGFTFNGWFSDAALTVPADFSAPVSASTTFYAKWTAVAPVTVTVSFDTNGHGTVAPVTVVTGGTVAKPVDPTAAGFTFNGWFSDAALTVPADFSAPVSASTTFYAKWTAVAPVTVTVSFATNGHGTVAPVTVVTGSSVAKPVDPTAAGFTFDGWFSDAALTVPVVFPAPVSASTTFFAKWTAVAPVTVTVSFDGNGHGASVAPVTVAVGATVAKPTDPTAAGFTFDGWFSDAALTVPVVFPAPVSASTTFYAKWSAVAPVTVTVSFDTNGHGTVAPVTVVTGGTVAKPVDPTAAGFTFNGWFSDAALTVPADFSAPVSASTTFFAKWTAVATPTPNPTTPPSITPAPPKAEGPLAKTGAAVDPSAASLALAALGLGAGLLAVRARRARKTN